MNIAPVNPRFLRLAAGVLAISRMMGQASAQFPSFSGSDAIDLESIQLTASDTFRSSECGIAILNMVDTFANGVCPELFNNILGFLSDVPLPDIDFSGNIDFDPPTLPDFLSLGSVCSAGGCVMDLSIAFDEVDEACFDSPVLVTTAQRQQIRLLRAMVGVTCLRDDVGAFCIPEAVEAFVNTARELVSGQETTVSGISGRDLICQPCAVEFQKEIFSVFDADAFSALSQLACLKDQTTGEYCSPNDLIGTGLAYAINPLSTSIDSDPALCMTCVNQAIGLVSPLVGNDDYPLSCYSEVPADQNLEISFIIEGFQTQFPVNGPTPQDAVRADCATAFRLPAEYISVTADIDYSAGWTRFTCTVSHTLEGVSVDQAEMRNQIENSPLTNLNQGYPYLADNRLDLLSANAVDPNQEDDNKPNVEESNDDEVSNAVVVVVIVVFFGILVASIVGCVLCCCNGCCSNGNRTSKDLGTLDGTVTVKAAPITVEAIPDTMVVEDTEQGSNAY